MSDTKGGSADKMPQVPVPDFEGLKLEPLNLDEVSRGDVASLPWDALNSSEFKVPKGERIDNLKKLFPQSLKTDNHLKLFVLRGEHGIDGFVAMKVDTGKRLGTLTHVWLSEKRHQAGALAEILHSSERHLRSLGCDDGIINAPHAMSTLNRVGSRSEPNNFWTFKTEVEEDAAPHGSVDKGY